MLLRVERVTQFCVKERSKIVAICIVVLAKLQLDPKRVIVIITIDIMNIVSVAVILLLVLMWVLEKL